ncbi:MAG: glycosyltransferase [Actinobacteria bacterium]|nr:glycosyltransferase [Actinomycetota bacterium]
MRVAIVHDYLTQRGGAERVVLSMMKAFPDAPLHTSLFDRTATFPDFATSDVRPMAINKLALLRRHHRMALPLLAPAFATHEVHADVVLCSSSGWAHGVRTTGVKVVYCYSPARWLYESETYLGNRQSVARWGLAAVRAPLVRWDRRMAGTASRYLTLSNVVRKRIQLTYGIEAEVLPPPPTIDVTAARRPPADLYPGFLLCVARLLPYKNVDAVVAAFQELPGERLVVVGIGPEEGRLRQLAGPNVRFLGLVDEEELRWLYGACAGVLSASYEDYGLTPLEAATFAKPVAVLRGGGFLDTVVEDETGVYFEQPVPAEIVVAVRRLLARAWPEERLQAHAACFDEARFVRRLREVIDEEVHRR